MTLQIDTLAYANQLRQLPPEHKLLFALTLLLITYVTCVPVQLIIALWISVWTVLYAKIPASTYLRLLTIPVGFLLMSLPTLAMNSVELADLAKVQVDVGWGLSLGKYYFYLSHQGMWQAMDLGIRAITATTCIYFAILTTPFTEILHILKRMRCPALLIDLLMLMYRFIFALLRTAQELWTAQQSRGGYRTRRLWFRSLGLLIGQLLRQTLVNYRRVTLSLESRGFTGEFRVCHSHRNRASRRYIWEAGLGCTVLVMLTGWYYAAGI